MAMLWVWSLLSALVPLALGYVLGSVPFGLVLTRAAGTPDLRSIGSGNIGATNVLRTGHRGLALATLLLDAAKGAVAVILAGGMAQAWPDLTPAPDWTAFLAGLGAVLGHLFPIWLKFKGGKGVSTALGVFLAWSPLMGGIAAAVWLIVAAAMRYSSLAALMMMAAAGTGAVLLDMPAQILLGVLLIVTLVVWRHRDNIRRLLRGEEPRIATRR